VKKEVSVLLNNLESRIGDVGRFDPTIYSREERKELIKEHAIKYLAGLHSDDRCKVIDEVVLLKMGGTGYRSMESRSGLEQAYGPELSDWPTEAKDRYLRNMLISWMADLEPADLKAIDEAAAKEADRN
jgi:hypothetical protein